ncbi:MAG: hypothetical protein PHQ75_00195 [Thermoguttaceae bacterium]|nr:hypothetical protein [Thermoguttaceae bacterium]
MRGQGCPKEKNRNRTARIFPRGSCFILFLLFAWGTQIFPLSAYAQEQTLFHPGNLRLNFTWCSEEPELWNGEIFLSAGGFSQSVILGKDPTNPQTFSFETASQGKITFCTTRQNIFCGVQTTVHAQLNATLTVNLRNPRWKEGISRSMMLSDLVRGPVYVPFDNKENGLLIERVVGDDLPVWVTSDSANATSGGLPSLVFEQGDTMRVAVFPRTAHYAGEEGLLLTARLVRSEQPQTELWSQVLQIPVPSPKTQYDFLVTLPNMAGPFDLQLTLARKKQGFSLIPTRDAQKKLILAQRTIQGVIVPPVAAVGKASSREEVEPSFDMRNGLLETIDPTNPSWWKVFSRNPVFLGAKVPVKPDLFANQADPAQIGHEQKPLDSNPLQASLPTVLGQKAASPNFDILSKWKWSDFQIRLTPHKIGTGWGQWDALWQHSLGSGHLKTFDSQQMQYSSFAQLVPSGTDEVPWESYTIPVKEPGKPHLLEIEYLSHIPQKLGISIIEPSVSGGVFPNTIDSGLVVDDSPLSDVTPNRVLNHQILFWPKTKAPMILIMNRDRNHPAVFGRIRLYRAKDEPASSSRSQQGRSFAAFMTRPTFADQFSAPRVPSPIGVAGADDWNTFYAGLDRTTNYLQAAGYDRLVLSVYADGSTLYPSKLLCPTPKFDSGVFLTRGEDPVRKDVLELAARLFDRRRLTLVPLLNFNSPLPALEEYYRRTVNEGNAARIRLAEGIYWTGPEGRRFIDARASATGTGPHYNILNPIVQRAVFDVIKELAVRYSRHPSVPGIALEISAGNFAHLPDDIYYGMDDTTFAKFMNETNLQKRINQLPAGEKTNQIQSRLQALLASSGMERYRIRAQFINDLCRQEWLKWRAQTLYRFYHEVRVQLATIRPDFNLWLVGTDMFDGLQSRTSLYPTLASTTDFAAVLQNIGIAPELFDADPLLTLLRPGQIDLNADLPGQIVPLELDTPDCIKLFSHNSTSPGTVFHHKPVTLNIPTFDRVCPFQPTITQISARMLPSDGENRKRFAHQLACCDTFAFLDGGDMIPLGQEAAIRDWISVFQRLPRQPFSTYIPNTDSKEEGKSKSLQPVVLRWLQTADATWGYMVNDSPFHTNVSLVIKHRLGAEIEIISGAFNVNDPKHDPGTLTWSLSLRPYDLVAFRLNDPGALFLTVDVMRPDEICGPEGTLITAVNNYVDRMLLARAGIETKIANGSFESPVAPVQTQVPPTEKSKTVLGIDVPKLNLLKAPFGGAAQNAKSDTQKAPSNTDPAETSMFAGWKQYGDSSFQAVLDPTVHRHGNYSMKLTSASGAGSLVSDHVEYDGTGRLCLQLSFGIPRGAASLPLNIALTGRYGNAPYNRQLTIGPTLLAKAARLAEKQQGGTAENMVWIEDVILFDRLPLDRLEDISLRFDMLGPGTVWVDNIKLYKFAFAESEQKEIVTLAAEIEKAVEQDRVGDTITMLDNYWSKLLAKQIPAGSPLLANVPKRPNQKTPAPVEEKKEEPPKQAKGFFERIFSR